MIENLILQLENLTLDDRATRSVTRMGTDGSAGMADFDRVGLFKGKQPASRWLARLVYEEKRVGKKSTPEEFFEAVEILFEDDAAMWLDSSARYRRIIDDRGNATKEDVEEFQAALKIEFPTKTPCSRNEKTLQEDIGGFAQGPEESLSSYYGRAQELLRRSHGRDAVAGGSSPLSPIETVVLSGIISAFLRGLVDVQVRTTVLMRSTDVTKSLRGAFEAAEDAKSTLERLQEFEKDREERKEFELLRTHYTREWGRPLSAVLAGINEDVQGKIGQNLAAEENPRSQIKPEGPRNNWAPIQKRQQETQFQARQNQRLHDRQDQPKMLQNTKGDGRGDIPPRHLSRHPLVNGSEKYNRNMGTLCVRCGEIGHIKPVCNTPPLEWWEQSLLKELTWPKADVNYAKVCGNRSGLRFRDIEDSNWRNNYRIHRRPEVGGTEVPLTTGIQNMSYEEFTGEPHVDVSALKTNSMSVILGIERETKEKGKHTPEKKVTFEDDLEETKITLQSFLNHGDIRKRARPIHIEDLLNEEEHDPKLRKKNKKQSERKLVRNLREIVGRQGKGPINYQKLVEDIKVEVSLMDLFQMSPDLSRAFRTLSTRVNKKVGRDINGKEKNIFLGKASFKDAGNDGSSESLLSEAIMPLETIEQKAFRVPVTVKTKKDGRVVDVTLPLSVSQADQGSDMIIVTVGFLRKLRLPAKRLSERGFQGLTMNVADGTSAELSYYSDFEIGVLGVWRKIEAFVRPFDDSNIDEVHLLLGLPWLHAVDANIKIRESIIEIGDVQRGEKVVKIQGPKFVESKSHRLVLCPKENRAAQPMVHQELSSEDSEDSAYDSDDTSDDSTSGMEDDQEKVCDLSKSLKGMRMI